jgi:hypothetical protein
MAFAGAHLPVIWLPQNPQAAFPAVHIADGVNVHIVWSHALPVPPPAPVIVPGVHGAALPPAPPPPAPAVVPAAPAAEPAMPPAPAMPPVPVVPAVEPAMPPVPVVPAVLPALPWSPAVPAPLPALPWSPAVPEPPVPEVPDELPAVPVVPEVPVFPVTLRRGLLVQATAPTTTKQDIAISVLFIENISSGFVRNVLG